MSTKDLSIITTRIPVRCRFILVHLPRGKLPYKGWTSLHTHRQLAVGSHKLSTLETHSYQVVKPKQLTHCRPPVVPVFFLYSERLLSCFNLLFSLRP